ncbi:ctenidin-1-like [Helianthus annuus]|uniref:ctenidin-1-like n=1 Tax=Helianthus annuus TaxID=4232 RepID=UPI000B8F30A0|nr:ctenidin-1-like [Helianthus annuus]
MAVVVGFTMMVAVLVDDVGGGKVAGGGENAASRPNQNSSSAGGGSGFVTSANATPNSILSEKAFKGLGVFDEDDSVYGSDREFDGDESETEFSVDGVNDGGGGGEKGVRGGGGGVGGGSGIRVWVGKEMSFYRVKL